jgi:hypothetical protein
MVDTAVLALQAARVDQLRPRARRLAVVIERDADVADQVEVVDKDVQVAGDQRSTTGHESRMRRPS